MTLLTTAEYRALHTTALGDEPLQLYLDAAEQDILDFVGPAVEWFGGGQTMLALRRPAASISSIVENPPYDGTPVTLAADDYLIDPTGLLLYRQSGGTNSRSRWYGRVVVTYTVADAEAQQMIVQADLVYLAETYSPGLTSTTVGSWTEQYKQATSSHLKERDEILARLTMRGRMTVV